MTDDAAGRPLLAEVIARRVVVLDGGLATQLEADGHDLSSALWSARLLLDDPGAIRSAHAAYFQAGAEVATTASYQASFQGFASLGLTADEGADLLRRSVQLAVEARDGFAPAGWVAASVGPYAAVLADGSEYRGDTGMSVADLRAFHRPRLDVLASAGADVLACETIGSLAEVEALMAEIDGSAVPAWLSVTCADGHRLRSGEPVAEAFAMAADVGEIIAVGINCSDPTDVLDVVEAAARVRPAIAYPNSGQVWDAATRTWSGESQFDRDLVHDWVEAGARIVGGCCRVGPDDIAAVAELVR